MHLACWLGYPFLHRPAYSIPVSSKSSQLTQSDYISLAAKVAVFSADLHKFGKPLLPSAMITCAAEQFDLIVYSLELAPRCLAEWIAHKGTIDQPPACRARHSTVWTWTFLCRCKCCCSSHSPRDHAGKMPSP